MGTSTYADDLDRPGRLRVSMTSNQDNRRAAVKGGVVGGVINDLLR